MLSITRRAFVRLAAVLSVAPSVLAAAVRDARMLQMNGYPGNAETPLDLLTDYLTPNDLFFVRSHWIPQMPDLKTWTLTVDGEVDKPVTLSMSDLRALPHAEV